MAEPYRYVSLIAALRVVTIQKYILDLIYCHHRHPCSINYYTKSRKYIYSAINGTMDTFQFSRILAHSTYTYVN